MLKALHHIQLAMPEGKEPQACAFYEGLLGLTQEAKPDALAKRGGVWFRRGSIRIHLGVETPFRPARKAHPAFQVDGLDEFANRLEQASFPIKWDADLEGYRRFYSEDPFGNRIEFLEPV